MSFKHHKEEAAALGLKKRLWDTLIGDDSAFVRWDMASKEGSPKKKKAKKTVSYTHLTLPTILRV